MDKLDINPRIISSLRKARLTGFGNILSLSKPELCRAAQLSAIDASILHKAVAKAITKRPNTTGLSLYRRECDQFRHWYLTSGCQVLDSFLRGGILSPTVTEIAGESASGKTQLCMQLCLTIQLPSGNGGANAGALYICTEDAFPNKRLVQMAALFKQRVDPALKNIQLTDNIFIEHVAEIDDLMHCLKNKLPVLLNSRRIKLIVIDSVAALFRSEFGIKDMAHRAKLLSSMAAVLHRLSSQYNIPVICVNQVTAVMKSSKDIDGPNVVPALGLAWANLVTVRLLLLRTTQTISLPIKDNQGQIQSHMDSVVRSMEVLFAPHLPNTVCHYIIDQDGVKGLS